MEQVKGDRDRIPHLAVDIGKENGQRISALRCAHSTRLRVWRLEAERKRHLACAPQSVTATPREFFACVAVVFVQDVKYACGRVNASACAQLCR